MSARILAIGDLTADLILGPLAALPDWGEEREVGSIDIRLGGNSGNLALAAAALGLDVTVIGPIGGDENGRFVTAALGEAGLPTLGLVVLPDAGTSLTVAMVREDGERLYVTYPGALERLGEILANAKFPPAEAAIFSGWCQPPRVDLPTLESACARLRAAGTCLALDLAWSAASWQDREALAGALALMDIVLLNMDEARALTGREGVAALAGVAAHLSSSAILVVKDGARGALLREPGGAVTAAPALPLAGPVMAVGAGDAFNAGLLHALLVEKARPAEAVRFASAFAGCWLARGRVRTIAPEAVREFARSRSADFLSSEAKTC